VGAMTGVGRERIFGATWASGTAGLIAERESGTGRGVGGRDESESGTGFERWPPARTGAGGGGEGGGNGGRRAGGRIVQQVSRIAGAASGRARCASEPCGSLPTSAVRGWCAVGGEMGRPRVGLPLNG